MSSRAPREHLRLRLPLNPASVGEGRRAASRFAQECGLAISTIWDVQLAVTEALTNAVLHAEQEDGELELHGECTATAVRYVVVDRGTGMRPRSDSPGLGLGLGLMQRASDELAFESVEGGGTSVSMLFHR